MSRITKTLSVILSLALLISAFVAVIPQNVSALTYRTGANSAHSSYKGSRFYSNFQKLELTGDGRTDVVAVALSQLGYVESSTAYDFDGEGAGSGNNTEYCYNMGNYGEGYGYYWCATFVSWALYQAQCSDQMGYADWIRNHKGDEDYIWCEVSCSTWANQLRLFNYFKKSAAAGNNYKPQSGDLIFFSWSGATSSEDHIGIVVYSDDSYVYTVEGNTSSQNSLDSNGDGLYFKKYALNYQYITGYGVLPYKTVDTVEKIDYSGENPTPGYYMCNASKYIYSSETATSSSLATLRYSMFEVTEIASNGRLKAKGITTTSGEVVEGYIENNTARVIQITSSETTLSEQLSNLIKLAESADEEDYTTENYESLQATLAKAQALLTDENATDDQLSEMISALETVINNKIPPEVIPVDSPDNYTFPTRDLYYNSSSSTVFTGDDVKWVQAMLVQLGYDIDIDGSYGPATKTVMTQFQSDYGLDPDGSCGPATRAKLSELWEEMKLANIEIALDVTFSNVEDGETVETATIGDTLYLGFDLTEAETGESINDVVEKTYTVTLSIVGPDGEAVETAELDSLDNGSISVITDAVGEYTATVTVEGDIDFAYEAVITVEAEYLLGDVNCDREVTSLDYIMIKRIIMETYTASAEALLAADVNKNGTIENADYILLKRAIMGTYTIA